MKPSALLHLRLAFRLLTLPLTTLLAHATPTTTQVITLNPGWNAIHIHLLPANPELNAVFSGLALDSVWAYESGQGSPDFIQEVTEPALAKAGWLSWVPANRVDAFQNSLFQLQVHRAYLVKFTGTTPASLTLTGRPSVRTFPWQPNALNFRGLPVDPAIPPTFLSFFQPSPAHYSAATGLEAIYRLDSAGAWHRVAPSDQIRHGEAYWIYCRGGSEYVAPLVVNPGRGDGFDFDFAADELDLNLVNLRSTGINVTVTDLASPTPNPLAYAERQPDQRLTWPELPTPWVRPVPSTTSTRERLAVRRASMTADLFETVLEITDGLGTRYLAPVSVVRQTAPAANVSAASGGGRLGRARPAASSEAISHAGLWVGTASVNALSEAHSGPLTTNLIEGFTLQMETNSVSRIVTTNRIPNSVLRTAPSMAPTPTASEFNLRLLVHVDATGQTRLLKEVIEMWQNGTTTNDAAGVASVDQPGRYVLVTDDRLIGQFTGISARDGVPVGRRLSTATFDFADNELPMTGDFAVGSSVIGTNNLSETFARNPFKHRYHPDHQKGFDIRRVIQLELSPPPSNPPPGYGERVLEGLYHETVSGLHRTNIVVRGTFRLNRIATTAVLNQ